MAETPPVYLANMRTLQPKEREALERLIAHAKRDSGQGQRAAGFLLAWWNAAECGGFDLTNLWTLDEGIAADMATVFAFIAKHSTYPDSLGYGDDFKEIVLAWRNR